MKQTAVDFLQDEILKDRMIKAKSIKEWNDVIDKARDMFQRQIIEAYATGSNDRLKSVINDYYNETYGSNGSDDRTMEEIEKLPY